VIDKGLEIVSVYIWERSANAQVNADRVKEFSETERITRQIISEALTEKAEQPKQGDFFSINGTGVPKILLIDKTGNIIDSEVRGEILQKKTGRIFFWKMIYVSIKYHGLSVIFGIYAMIFADNLCCHFEKYRFFDFS
jgi:hypothetical protein